MARPKTAAPAQPKNATVTQTEALAHVNAAIAAGERSTTLPDGLSDDDTAAVQAHLQVCGYQVNDDGSIYL